MLCFVVNSFLLTGQNFFHLKETKSDKIRFELIGNLIVLPVEVNGTELSFILDTGVSKPILFNITETDSVGLKNTDAIFLYGLGGNGKLEALKSLGNLIKVGNVHLFNRDLYVVYDEDINFTPRLGMLVHGIIGYDVFEDFIVEVNYSSKYLRLYKPDSFKELSTKKWQKLPLEIYNKKPYLNAHVTISKTPIAVKLLLDTGSSDAVWLFKDEDKGILPNKELIFEDYLGKGLSGSIYGNRSRLRHISIGDYILDQPNVAFPDSASVDLRKTYKARNGSLGGDILKRFNHYFNYSKGELHIKRNSHYKEPFTYNNSGIVIEYNGIMLVQEEIELSQSTNSQGSGAVRINQVLRNTISIKPAFEIVEIRESSNAFTSGLRIGDVLVSINGKKAYDFELNKINEILHGKTGTPIRMRIQRLGVEMEFRFKLDDAFIKNKPSR